MSPGRGSSRWTSCRSERPGNNAVSLGAGPPRLSRTQAARRSTTRVSLPSLDADQNKLRRRESSWCPKRRTRRNLCTRPRIEHDGRPTSAPHRRHWRAARARMMTRLTRPIRLQARCRRCRGPSQIYRSSRRACHFLARIHKWTALHRLPSPRQTRSLQASELFRRSLPSDHRPSACRRKTRMCRCRYPHHHRSTCQQSHEHYHQSQAQSLTPQNQHFLLEAHQR